MGAMQKMKKTMVQQVSDTVVKSIHSMHSHNELSSEKPVFLFLPFSLLEVWICISRLSSIQVIPPLPPKGCNGLGG
jgi:hypothetical protein